MKHTIACDVVLIKGLIRITLLVFIVSVVINISVLAVKITHDTDKVPLFYPFHILSHQLICILEHLILLSIASLIFIVHLMIPSNLLQ